MRLENLNVDALDPHRLAAFWAAALQAEQVTEEEDLAEIRVTLPEGRFLDLCFERVPDPSPAKARVHPDLTGGARQQEEVDRLLGLGATHAYIGQGDVPWVVLADPEGNTFCVMDEREAYRGTGVFTALILEGTDPARDADFWAVATGWERVPGVAAASLRHPSGTGPLLEFLTQSGPKRGKNRMHLDVRPGPDDGPVADRLRAAGARLLADHPDWPWSTWADPSGNEFCLLAPQSSPYQPAMSWGSGQPP